MRIRSGRSKSIDITEELRETIFASRQGECFTEDVLRELYEAESARTVGRRGLAHLASCPECLESVNQLLGLSPLVEPYAEEASDSAKSPFNGGVPAGASGRGWPPDSVASA